MSCVRTEPASPLVSILCGVIGAVVVVFLVIVVTMKVRILLSPTSHFKHLLSEFYSFNIMCCVIWKNPAMLLLMLGGGGWKK